MKSPKNRKAEQDAARMYAGRRRDIDYLVKRLRAELAEHARRARKDPANWGYAGDLGAFRGRLAELVGFITGLDADGVNKDLPFGE